MGGLAGATPQDVEAHLVRLVFPAMREHGVVGAGVAVVRAGVGGAGGAGAGHPLREPLAPWDAPSGGEEVGPEPSGAPPVQLYRGFGFENEETNAVVDAEATLFDSGGCARLLALLAVLQLEQDGVLDQGRSVQGYLPTQLERKLGDAIAGVTVESLLHGGAAPARPPPGVPAGKEEGRDGAGGGRKGTGGGAAAEEAAGGGAGGEQRAETPTHRLSDLMRSLLASDFTGAFPAPPLSTGCCCNYNLLGAVVEFLSALEYSQFVTQRVLGPLQLALMDYGDRGKAKRVYTKTLAGRAGADEEVRRLTPAGHLVGTGKQMARLLYAVVEGLRGALEHAVLEEAADRLQRVAVPWEGREFSYCFERRRLWPAGPLVYVCAEEGRESPQALLCVEPQVGWGIWVGTNTVFPEASGGFERSFCGAILEGFLKDFAPWSPAVVLDEPNWFQPMLPVRKDPAVNLFCFPYAGGSSPVLYEAWQAQLPEFVQVLAVLVPGRGRRVKEESRTNLLSLAANIAVAILPRVKDKARKFAFFGHGVGAILAYEVARFIRHQYDEEPVHLFVSGSLPPVLCGLGSAKRMPWAGELADSVLEVQVEASVLINEEAPAPNAYHPPFKLHALSESVLLKSLENSPSTPEAYKQNALTLRAMISTIRADLELEETYRYEQNFGMLPRRWMGESWGINREADTRSGVEGSAAEAQAEGDKARASCPPRLACPITAFLGKDDIYLDMEDTHGWKLGPEVPFHAQRLPGTHECLERGKVVQLVTNTIATVLARSLTKYHSWALWADPAAQSPSPGIKKY